MNSDTALKTISALSDGVNPDTGELLAQDSTFNQPNVIRALLIAKQSLQRCIANESRKQQLPPNAGKPWSAEEDAQLSAGFDSGMALKELCEQHGRTRGSIVARLEKLGKSLK